MAWCLQATPLSIKLATVVGMGLLIALIGMVSIHIVVSNPQVRRACCAAPPPLHCLSRCPHSIPRLCGLAVVGRGLQQTLVSVGDISDYRIWLSLGGLVLTGSLLYHQVRPPPLPCLGCPSLIAAVLCCFSSACVGRR